MKAYTSRFLKVVALAYLLFPLTYLGITTVLFDVPLESCLGALLSPVFYFSSAVGILTGYGLREMRRWAWYSLLVSSSFVAYENAVILHDYAQTHHKIEAYGVSMLLLALLLHRISREVRVPYFFPKIRWWESNPRYKLSVPVHLGRGGGTQLDGEIMDLSQGGCFIKLRADMIQDETVDLTFKVFGLAVECKGTIVWRTQSTVTHPRGVGVKFALDSRVQKRVLRLITSRLRKIAALYRRSRYLMNQDEFLKRLDELERNHKIGA